MGVDHSAVVPDFLTKQVNGHQMQCLAVHHQDGHGQTVGVGDQLPQGPTTTTGLAGQFGDQLGFHHGPNPSGHRG